jgi:hypothetical protein
MKKFLWIMTGAALTIAVLAGAGFVYARSTSSGSGVFLQRDTTFGPYGRGDGFSGEHPLHEFMAAAVAEEFDLTVEELEELHEQGIPLVNYALDELGLSMDEFHQKMTDARASAIQAALEEGVISEEEAEFFLERGMRGGRGQYRDCLDGSFDGYHHPGMHRGGRWGEQ